ncbi:uncharacterized protein LOC119076833 isoform X2 [Bradysia coprophila]|nr:uncharacterized protein LOC119076833 isoform X2 [Bradysia coprophila]
MNTVLALIFAVRKICEDITSGPKAATLNARLDKTYRLIRVYTVGLSAVIVFYVSVAMKFFLIDGIYYPLMPINIPLCDGETLKGYLSMLAIQLVFGVYSAVATLTFGTSFLILLGNYGLMADLIELDFTELNNMWTISTEMSLAYRHAFLNNIVRKLQDMQFYMSEIKRIYELKLFVYFLISYVGQVICLYQIIQKNWLPGYTPLFTVFIEMSFYCGIGTQITILGEKMCSYIQETNWYVYDLYTQKTLRFLLQMCQRPCEISLQSLGPLNMVTGVAFVKGIYYYYTGLTKMM